MGDYPNRSLEATGVITYLNPCDTPFSFTVPDSTIRTVGPYEYDNSVLTYDLVQFVVDPPICVITYRCDMYSMPDALTCDSDETSFDTTTG